MGASIAFLIMGIDFGPIATQIYLKRHWLLFSFVAPDATQLGEHTVTQKHLYLGLFVIGIPLVWFADPFGTVFWIIGASAVLILVHASIMEPGVESEYASIDGETVWMAGDADLLDPHHPFNSSLFISGPFLFLFLPLLSFNKLFLGISVPDNLLYESLQCERIAKRRIIGIPQKETSEMSNGSLIIPKTTYDHMFISVYLCNPSGTSRRTTVVCVTVSFCWDNVTHDFSDPSDTVKKKPNWNGAGHIAGTLGELAIYIGVYILFFSSIPAYDVQILCKSLQC